MCVIGDVQHAENVQRAVTWTSDHNVMYATEELRPGGGSARTNYAAWQLCQCRASVLSSEILSERLFKQHPETQRTITKEQIVPAFSAKGCKSAEATGSSKGAMMAAMKAARADAAE